MGADRTSRQRRLGTRRAENGRIGVRTFQRSPSGGNRHRDVGIAKHFGGTGLFDQLLVDEFSRDVHREIGVLGDSLGAT